MLALLCLVATIAYVQRNSIAIAEETIREELHLTKRQSGVVISAFFLSYALFQLPSGWLAHIWGSRRGLTVFATAWSALTGLMAVGTGLWSLAAVRFGMGAAQAGVFPCATDTISKWFPGGARAIASGSLGGFMSVGLFLGALLTGWLLEPLGWRLLFVYYALPGLIWAAVFWLWFRDRPEEMDAARWQRAEPAGETAEESAVPPRQPTPWGAILGSGTMWWIGGQQFFRAAGYMFFASWFATYLKETRGVSIPESGMLTALPVIATAAGCLAGGAVSDAVLAWTGSRRLARQGVAATSMAACAGLVFTAYFFPNPWVAVALISGGAFWAGVGGPCSYTITIDLGGEHVTTVFSFMNMCGNVGAVVFPLAVPELVEATGRWDLVLLLFGGVYLAAGACWLAFNPERPIAGLGRPPTRAHTRL